MEAEDNKDQQLDELLIKYMVGSASESERDIALSWINENHAHQKYFDELKAYYHLTKVVQQPSGFNKEEGWNRVQAGYYKNLYLSRSQEDKKQIRNRLMRIGISAAALIVLAFMLGIFTNRYQQAKKTRIDGLAFNEIAVPLGAKSHITLSDGTKVWLNAGSKLRYPVNFLAGTREVYLEGEAFFDVTKVKGRLFVVKTSDLNIKVYGTQFNVKSYPDENHIQTTLVKGSVAIEPSQKSSDRQTVFLKPNQTVTYYKSISNKAKTSKQTSSDPDVERMQQLSEKMAEKIIVTPKVDPIPITSWKDSLWVIVGEDLSRLAVKLERRYNVKISFKNESLKSYKFSGTLKEETFEQVLKIIQLSAPIQYTIENNDVRFIEDPLYKKKYDRMISKTNQ